LPGQPSGPLEILEKFDIGTSQIESFSAGSRCSAGEDDVLSQDFVSLPAVGARQSDAVAAEGRWMGKQVAAGGRSNIVMQVVPCERSRKAGRSACGFRPSKPSSTSLTATIRVRMALADSP